MDRIAKETGGLHINAEKTDPQTYFSQIAEELRTSYEVAFYPSNNAKDESFRKIVIRPKIDGVTIRAKTGYFSRVSVGAQKNLTTSRINLDVGFELVIVAEVNDVVGAEVATPFTTQALSMDRKQKRFPFNQHVRIIDRGLDRIDREI